MLFKIDLRLNSSTQREEQSTVHRPQHCVTSLWNQPTNCSVSEPSNCQSDEWPANQTVDRQIDLPTNRPAEHPTNRRQTTLSMTQAVKSSNQSTN